MAGGHPQPESINGRRGSQSAVRHTDGMGTGALPFSGKSLLDSLIHLPLVLPPVVVGYLLLISMGRKGIIGEWLYNWFGFSFTFSWRGAALAAAVVAFPLMVRAIRLALEAVDMRPEQAARTLGASPLRVFSPSHCRCRCGVLLSVLCWHLPVRWGIRRDNHLCFQYPGKPGLSRWPCTPCLKRRGGNGRSAALYYRHCSGTGFTAGLGMADPLGAQTPGGAAC